MSEILMVVAALVVGLGLTVFLAMLFRVVVPTNEVHIVQSAKKTISYGANTTNGNTYYQWPSFLPIIGITKVVLPLNNFEIILEGHKVYDKDRLPLHIDVTSFFRIENSSVAAQRVSSFDELKNQLTAMIESVAINIMGTETVEGIMESRAELGLKFEAEMKKYLPEWGVVTVRNLAIKDVKDADGSKAIASITDKRKSAIDSESRQEVAKNRQAAETAEIQSARQVDLQKQEAAQTVGLRKIEAERQVQLSNEQKLQAVKELEKTTKIREMEVLQVQETRKAEILKEMTIIKFNQDKETALIRAEQDKQTQLINAEASSRSAIISAEASKTSLTLEAEGKLQQELKAAEGVAAQGKAQAEAQTAMNLAPVQAQITLAKEIGNNQGYQNYLIKKEQIAAVQAVGVKQAEALKEAEIKIISTTGTPSAGLNSVGELFTPQGGIALGSMLEGLKNTDMGAAVLEKVGLTEVKKAE